MTQMAKYGGWGYVNYRKPSVITVPSAVLFWIRFKLWHLL
jgi:hypothetical protein